MSKVVSYNLLLNFFLTVIELLCSISKCMFFECKYLDRHGSTTDLKHYSHITYIATVHPQIYHYDYTIVEPSDHCIYPVIIFIQCSAIFITNYNRNESTACSDSIQTLRESSVSHLSNAQL